ncbi:MAG: hypothetical protein ACKOGD_00470, partial [Sphingomonadales bacterium]
MRIIRGTLKGKLCATPPGFPSRPTTDFAKEGLFNRETLKKLFYAIEAEHADIKNKQKRYSEVMKNPYFNALQVKYAHAVTVHKAQGGQWAHVYI